MSSNVDSNPAVITTEGGAFNVNSRSGMKDACSYDLRDHQEPATVQKEYGGNAAENKDLQGLQSKVESTPGPDVKPHVGAEPSNGSADLGSGKPLSTSSAKSIGNGNNHGDNNIALDPSLGQDGGNNQQRPNVRAGQPSFLKNTGDGVIRTPGPGQMTQLQGSPRQQQMQMPPPQQRQGSPMQQSAQYNPQVQTQQQQRDIQVPQMSLPQMPSPQQPQQNSFQAQLQQPPPPGQAFDGSEAQLLAALGASHPLAQQGSPQNRGQQLPNSQQQQQQRAMQHMGKQGSPQQQRQLQTQPAPQPMTVQQQNAARQAAYQGFMAHPPPTGPNSSTDIQVPQANAPTSNVGTPSAGQSSLPPLPNFQSAPAPLAFNDGSFFSHQAILASLAAEEQAKAAAAAAAVMGFQNGTWFGGNGQQQQQQNGGNNQGQYNFAQPGQAGQQQQQQGQQNQLPNFAAPGTSSVLGDFSFEQHFGAPTPTGNSPDASTSSRKRIKGKSGSRGSQPQYNGAFNFGTYAANSSAHPNNNEFEVDGEEDDTKPQFNSRGIQKRKSASTARELVQAQQKDHGEEYEYQGYVPKGSGTPGGVTGAALPPPANLGPGGREQSDDSDDDDDGDEWVAEESDDSYGKKKKGGNKRGRKSMSSKYASLTPAEAEALRAASPTTAAAALASVNANGQFDFSQLLGDYSVGSPDSASGSTPGASKKRKSNAAAPGSGNISCDYVDPKTGERCPVKFRRPYDQARHMETVHSGTAEKSKWACITCKKSFSRKDALIRHGRISNHATM